MTNPNNPAIPATIAMTANPGNYISVTPSGLTKREYFAAMAMQGIVANNRLVENQYETGADDFGVWEAGKAVALADALIAELNK